MASSQVDDSVSDEDFFDDNRRRRDSRKLSNDVVEDEVPLQSSSSRKSSTSHISNTSDNDSGDDHSPNKNGSSKSSVESTSSSKRVIHARLPYTGDVESESELSDTRHSLSPDSSGKTTTMGNKSRKKSNLENGGAHSSESEEKTGSPEGVRRELSARNRRRVKSAPTREARSSSASAFKPEDKLTNYKELLREVLELDSRYKCYSRPASASTSSSVWKSSRPKTATVEMPYRWRRNYTFTDEKIKWIERENKRLLSKIQNSASEVNKTRSSSGQSLNKPTAAQINRSRQQRLIEVENLSMLKRLQSVQPSKDLSRHFLLDDYVQRLTGYHGGSANIIWARPQEPQKSRLNDSHPHQAVRGRQSKKLITASDTP